MTTAALSGERYSSKVAAVFDGEPAARDAALHLLTDAHLRIEQVSVVQPYATHIGRKVEPESRGIAKTLVISHVYLGCAGALVGIVAAGVIVAAQAGPFASAPLITLAVGLALGAVAGLLIAGLYSLRPDHLALMARIRTAAAHGRWTVIVNVSNSAEKARVEAILGDRADGLHHTW